MDLTDIERHFGGTDEAMRELNKRGVTVYRQLWRNWRKEIPHGRQCEIELATKGKLKADKLK